MATKLFLRNTTNNGITDTGDGILYDMVTTAGASSDTAVVDTVASGTEIQFTKTAGGSTIAWISGRAPAGGFTLTTTDVDAWLHESHMNANIGGRYRIFKRTAAGSVSELGGGPFNDGVEMAIGTTASHTWTGNPTDTAFAEDDRILVRFYITNIGTMASGHTGTLTFNAADVSDGDSFFNIAETVSFKAENPPPQTFSPGAAVGTFVANQATFTPGGVTFSPGAAVGVFVANQVTFQNALTFSPGVAVGSFVANQVTFTPGGVTFSPGAAVLRAVANQATFTPGPVTFEAGVAVGVWVGNQVVFSLGGAGGPVFLLRSTGYHD